MSGICIKCHPPNVLHLATASVRSPSAGGGIIAIYSRCTLLCCCCFQRWCSYFLWMTPGSLLPIECFSKAIRGNARLFVSSTKPLVDNRLKLFTSGGPRLPIPTQTETTLYHCLQILIVHQHLCFSASWSTGSEAGWLNLLKLGGAVE